LRNLEDLYESGGIKLLAERLRTVNTLLKFCDLESEETSPFTRKELSRLFKTPGFLSELLELSPEEKRELNALWDFETIPETFTQRAV